jgi:FMN-dependent NADH-azoreductase
MTMNILHIDSSVLSANSVSRQLTAQVVHHLQQHAAKAQLVYRDLSLAPINHLSSEILNSRFTPANQWSLQQQQEAALTEVLLEEVLMADLLVIGAPMYNFSIPTQLKSWIDRILIAGRTFKYTEQGPMGLLKNKKAIVISSRGGFYSTTDAGRMADFQEDYLHTVLGFIGITDRTIIRAEGVNVSPDNKIEAIDRAMAVIAQLAA